uniref:DUF38 domain-containing protein n=1 Tax=Panagrolaimus sp. PS1159 TaxID=55785 RepID=A0AC35GQK6_9BILA
MDESNLPISVKIPAYPPLSDFPADVLKWMKQNVLSSPRLAVKLMKLNKYFLHSQFPYICIKCILTPFELGADEWYVKNLDDSWVNGINLNDIPDNIWLTESLTFDKPNLVPQLLPKVVVFDITELVLMSNSFVTCLINHFKLITSGRKLERLYLRQILFIDDNGENMPYDVMLEYVPDLAFLNLSFIDLQLSSPNIIDKLVTSKLQRLILTEIPDSFDFEALLNSLKQKPDLYVRLQFQDTITPEYCAKLQVFIDKVIQAGLTQFFPPRFDFPGTTDESTLALKKLRRAYKKNFQQHFTG